MTSSQLTGLRALPEVRLSARRWDATRDFAYRMAFGAVGWPWLLRSLSGGSRASRGRLLERLALAPDALPHLGSWKADSGFLHRIVDMIERTRPATVVELGAGASTLVCAKALALAGGGRMVSYDQHAGFVAAVAHWLTENGLEGALHHAPLRRRVPGWPGTWYELADVPDAIDLLVIDGPPWAVHPYVRGAAESLFDRLTPGAILLLDDAARPGERVIARRWRRRWPHMRFRRIGGSSKGTLIGQRSDAEGRTPIIDALTRRTRD